MESIAWIWQLMGRFHPLLVHFPIGILILALFMECLTIGGKRQGLREGIQWMVYSGSFFAVFSAISGYLLRTHDDYNGQIVDYHQYLGIATAIFVCLAAFLLRKARQQSIPNYLWYRSFF